MRRLSKERWSFPTGSLASVLVKYDTAVVLAGDQCFYCSLVVCTIKCSVHAHGMYTQRQRLSMLRQRQRRVRPLSSPLLRQLSLSSADGQTVAATLVNDRPSHSLVSFRTKNRFLQSKHRPPTQSFVLAYLCLKLEKSFRRRHVVLVLIGV